MSGSYQKVKVILLHDINVVGVGEEEPTYIYIFFSFFAGGGGHAEGQNIGTGVAVLTNYCQHYKGQ